VVGPTGDLVFFEKMDNTQYASVTIAQHKARTAAIFRRPTKAFEENLGKGFEFIYQMTLDGMIGSQGGVPLVVGGKIVGAIGCSGGAGSQDLQTCMAGVEALK
jgi:glc operon protein GlcG